MGSKDRDTKSLQDKLKVFFKKGPNVGLPPLRQELLVSPELERELSVEAGPARRLRAMRDLAERTHHMPMTEGGVARVWALVRDTLRPGGGGAGGELRGGALRLLAALAQAQRGQLQLLRTVLLRWLRAALAEPAAAPPDDAQLRFKLLYNLTNSGKDIAGLEDDICGVCVRWAGGAAGAPLLPELLALLTTVVKYNAAYLSDTDLTLVLQLACGTCRTGTAAEAVAGALALCEAVAAYALVPSGALAPLAAALLASLAAPPAARAAWRLLRALLGGAAQHAVLSHLLDAASDPDNPHIVRAAVFAVGAALWGPRRVASLSAPLSGVLSALLGAARLREPAVTAELLGALQALLARHSHELHELEWDALLRLLTAAAEQLPAAGGGPVERGLHATLEAVERLQDAGRAGAGGGSAWAALAERVLGGRGADAGMRVLAWRLGALRGAGDWAAAAAQLWEQFVRAEGRRALRLPALRALLAAAPADDALERVLLPALAAAAGDPDVAVRAAAAQAVPGLARAAPPDQAADLLDLLEKVLNRPFEIYVTDVCLDADTDVSDLLAAVESLVTVVRARLLRPPGGVAARGILHLVEHLDRHYRRPALLAAHPGVRQRALAALLALRAGRRGALGWAEPEADEVAECSPFLLLEPFQPRTPPVPPPPPPPPPLPQGGVVVTAGRGARVLRAALTRETHWAVLRALLAALPALLGGRPLLLGRRAADTDLLAQTLCALMSDRALRLPESLVGAPGAAEWAGAVLAALAALAPHHAQLEPATLQRYVRTLLKYPYAMRAPAGLLGALTQLVLEWGAGMARLLPDVLLDLSKVSDTSQHAAPVLELLSTLTRLPRVFASFVEDQYMAVFAIVLPYTNPSRYNPYVVSLAHHVIAAWFLKCRLSYRRNFVRFIIHGLHNYILVPFEQQRQQAPASNEDSSTRQRSSSLGSRGAGAGSGAAAVGRGGARGAGAARGAAEASAAFHVELTETCVDLLARYTFTPCSVKPNRSELVEQVFRDGQSGTWLVGHRVVTITTSRCQHHALKGDLCDRCAQVCRQVGEAPPASPPHSPPPAPAARPNSGEEKSDPVLHELTQRFDSLARESEAAAAAAISGGSTASGGGGGGACACWCGAWAWVTVRACTGDVGWLQRVHNRLHAAPPPPPPAARSHVLEYEDEMRSRSDSAPLPRHLTIGDLSTKPTVLPAAPLVPAAPLLPAAPAAPASDSVRDSTQDGGKEDSRSDAPLSRSSTAPINIPRAAADDLPPLLLPQGKSRQPVKRSNSSPEMSSWKEHAPPAARAPATPADRLSPVDHIMLDGNTCSTATTNTSMASKKATNKKADMRVSCEAIPEEMYGSSPLAAAAPLPAAPLPAAPLPAAPATTATVEKTVSIKDEKSVPAVVASTPAPHTHHHLQKTASDSTVGGGAGDELPPLARPKRSNTISVCSPDHRLRENLQARAAAAGGAGSGGSVGGSSSVGGGGAGVGGGVTPEFVLLQLYHNMSTSPISPSLLSDADGAAPAAERPLRLSGAQHERSLKNLDLLPPLDTFKVGVLYVAPGQLEDEVAILSNEYGSVRYCAFVAGLGAAVPLTGTAAREAQWLGVERGGRDGRFATVWRDDTLHVQFHVATLMPRAPGDPACNEKRKYIGNDPVSIVYNEAGAPFPPNTIKGQHNLAVVEVRPLPGGLARVRLLARDERVRRQFLPHARPAVASDAAAPLLARQLALHAALAAQLAASLALGGAPQASNMLERLRLIKRLRRRALAERAARAAPPPYAAPPHPRASIDDFNDYT